MFNFILLWVSKIVITQFNSVLNNIATSNSLLDSHLEWIKKERLKI